MPDLYGIVLANAMVMDARLDWIAFQRIAWIRPQAAWDMLLRCGTLSDLLHAPRGALCSILDTDWPQIEQLRSQLDWNRARRDAEYIKRHGIQLLVRGSEGYPQLLEEINDPPLILFWRGTLQPPPQNLISVVGSRKPTSYGLKMTRHIVSELAAAGVTVISGLAYGIDACAHHAALDAGGTTIAVLASGIDDITPHAHQQLGQKILQSGALCSEVPIGMPAHASHFLWRNRIISGLSPATLLIECTERSGSMVTAKHAADQGRDVFAVPGAIDSALSKGPNRLIQDGARSCICAEDITNPKPVIFPEDKKYGQPKGLDDTTAQLLETLTTGPHSANQLAAALNMPITRLLQLVTELECDDIIRVLPGGFIAQR